MPGRAFHGVRPGRPLVRLWPIAPLATAVAFPGEEAKLDELDANLKALAAACNDYSVEYVTIDYHKRLGTSKIRPRHAYDFAILILRTIVFFNPLKVFIPLGSVLAVAGLAKFAYDVTRNNLSESAVLAFLGALIVWCVGLLADQNARIASLPR